LPYHASGPLSLLETFPNYSNAFENVNTRFAPIVVTELANAPDWLPLAISFDGERFSMAEGTVESFSRTLDLRTGVLTRTVRWRSPGGRVATFTFERFVSLADEHLLCLRCNVTPEFTGSLDIHATLNGCTDNDGLAHWRRQAQGERNGAIYLSNRTRQSGIDVALAMRTLTTSGKCVEQAYWNVPNVPTMMLKFSARAGEAIAVDKFVSVFTSRDTASVIDSAVQHAGAPVTWADALDANAAAWANEWLRSDILIEGDEEAQIAMRFNLYHMLIAAPRHDDGVNIGAKTLSGFGYRGHAFWDTEIFMLPLFIYTAPHIARNLLNYRYQRLPAARQKAKANGYEGAQFPWESADTGEEVTPTWVTHFADRTKLVRIWTGDIEIHISADIAYATCLYWRITGDDAWFIEKGAEVVLDTAKFWGARAEWNAARDCHEYRDVIGPDENHEHVNNNAYTNAMAQWNLRTAFAVLAWLKEHAPDVAERLIATLDLSEARFTHWRDVIAKVAIRQEANGLIEQFDGFYQLRQVLMADLEPRTRSAQEIFGIEGANHVQAIKQPDVLMMQYLLRDNYSNEIVRVNYDYYNPRTDLAYGSSLGPSIQAVMACQVGDAEGAYEHFIRAARADLRDVRGNAGDGIHAASAAGTWHSVVFGFAGLRIAPDGSGWTVRPCLPAHWKRLSFSFFLKGLRQDVNITA
jgi:trehalose/maltose hydrolase-like predicted phosphorylase